MIDHKNLQRNLFAVENAIAQQRIEGLEVPSDIVEDMRRAARGEITIKEGISNTLRKFCHEQIRGERPLPR